MQTLPPWFVTFAHKKIPQSYGSQLISSVPQILAINAQEPQAKVSSLTEPILDNYCV